MSGSYVYNGQVASGTTVHSGAWQNVYSGGAASGTTVHSGGALYVYGGGSALGVNWLAGGHVSVSVAPDGTLVAGSNERGSFSLSGGVAKNFILYAGDHQYVSSGGSASGTTVHSGAWQNVYSGGAAIDTIVCSGGWQYVYSGGTIRNTSVYAGGNQSLASGAIVYNAKLVDDSRQTVWSGATASGAVIGVSCFQTVKANGSSIKTIVTSGGIQNVAGWAKRTIVSRGGRLNVKSGGVASATMVLAGGSEIISRGGRDFGATVAGSQTLVAGAGATSVRVNSGGVQSVAGRAVTLASIASSFSLGSGWGGLPSKVTASALTWQASSGGASGTLTLSRSGKTYAVSGHCSGYVQKNPVKVTFTYARGRLTGKLWASAGYYSPNIKDFIISGSLVCSGGKTCFVGSGAGYIEGLQAKVSVNNSSCKGTASGYVSGAYVTASFRNSGNYLTAKLTASYGGRTRSATSSVYFN